MTAKGFKGKTPGTCWSTFAHHWVVPKNALFDNVLRVFPDTHTDSQRHFRGRADHWRDSRAVSSPVARRGPPGWPIREASAIVQWRDAIRVWLWANAAAKLAQSLSRLVHRRRLENTLTMLWSRKETQETWHGVNNRARNAATRGGFVPCPRSTIVGRLRESKSRSVVGRLMFLLSQPRDPESGTSSLILSVGRRNVNTTRIPRNYVIVVADVDAHRPNVSFSLCTFKRVSAAAGRITRTKIDDATDSRGATESPARRPIRDWPLVESPVAPRESSGALG